MTWQGENFGPAIKALAMAIEPDRPALQHGDRIIDWAELDRLTDSIAAGLLKQGLKQGDVAGQMLRNSPEYLLAYFGCAKAGITPVNVNYNYRDRELADIFARFGLKALFVNSEYVETAARAMPEGSLDPFVAEPGNARWEELCATETGDDFAVCDDRSALFYMATGGTTGMPKAVMWPHQDWWEGTGVSVWSSNPLAVPYVATSLQDHAEKAAEWTPDHPDSPAPMLLLCPLMHGTAQYSAIGHLLHGGTIVTLPGTSFDADATIETIRDNRIRTMVMVGDAHAVPLLDALEARADGADAIRSLRVAGSSGAIFSSANKDRFTRLHPDLLIVDVLGSSESGGGTALRLTTKDGTTGGGNFTVVPDRGITLFDDNLKEIPPGAAGVGMVARSGPLPLGYLGEDEKNAATFPVIDGKRYLLTGDRARWAEDGSLAFIGRDNMCINTGGEKVFPEEVEAVLQHHASVRDVRVVSLPDERFGRKVVAVVQPETEREGMAELLDACAREGLASYKVPRAYFFTQDSLRLNNGKPDYQTAQRIADEAVGSG